MEMQNIIDAVRSFEGALVLRPDESTDFPEIAWGDTFFYYAPDGVMPQRTQPYATIITKNYPDDAQSRLDQPDRFRINIQAGRDQMRALVEGDDPSEPDRFVEHPIYGPVGWVSVVNPARQTSERILVLLRDAHSAAKARVIRRGRGE